MPKLTTLLACGITLTLPLTGHADDPLKGSQDYSVAVTPLSLGETSEVQDALVQGLKAQASIYASVTTLDGNASFKDLDPTSAYLPGKLHMALNLEKFAYDYEPEHRPGEYSGATKGAFDGVTYQELRKEVEYLTLSKLHPNCAHDFRMGDLILRPYVYFTREERSDDDGAHVLTAADLADPSRWKDFTAHMTLVGTATVLGVKTIAVELPFRYEVYTGQQGRIRYFLNPQADYYPMGWDAVEERGRVIESYRITELGWAEVKPGIRLSYPKTAIEQFFWVREPDNTLNFLPWAGAANEIDVSSMKVNLPLPENAFTIDRSSAKTIRDRTQEK